MKRTLLGVAAGIAILIALCCWDSPSATPSPAAPQTVVPALSTAPAPQSAGPREDASRDPAPAAPEHPCEAHSAPAPAPAPADLPTVPVIRGGEGALETISERSLALIIDFDASGVTGVESVVKELPYRKLSARALGDYAYQLQDAAGTVLHQGRFEARGLCPLAGAEHGEDHVLGHVVLAHDASVLIRVPDLPGASVVQLWRALPGVDAEPSSLGTHALRSF